MIFRIEIANCIPKNQIILHSYRSAGSASLGVCIRNGQRLVITGGFVGEKPLVRLGNSVSKPYGRPPPESADFVGAHEFPGRSVGFGEVVLDSALETDDFAHELRQLADADIFSGADVYLQRVGIGLHQDNAGVGAIIDVQELPPRRSGAPDDDALRAALLGFVRLAKESRKNVARPQIEIVSRTIKIRRHGRDEITAMLPTISLDHLYACNLGDRVPLVGRL